MSQPGVKGDRGAKLMAEIFRCQIAVNSIEHGKTAHRIAENGDPRRIDEIQLRQVAQRRVGIERLLDASAAATAGDAARAEAVDGKGHVPPGTQPIGDPGEMPGNANAAVQYDNRRERTTAVGRIVAVELYRRGDLPACVPGGWEIRPGRRPTRRPHRAMRQAPSQAGKFAKRASSGDAERVQSASPAAMARYERGSSTKTSRGVVPLSGKIP